MKTIYRAVENSLTVESDSLDREMALGEEDFVAFSYSGTYYDTVNDTLVDVADHSGTSDHYANYQKADTCSGVAAGAVELQRLIARITQLDPTTEIDIVAHSMGGLVSTYLLATADSETRKRIRSITTLDSPLQGTVWLVPFSACSYTGSGSWRDLAIGSEVTEIISTIGGTTLAEKIGSINSAIGDPISGEASLATFCGSVNPVTAHNCVWNDAGALQAIAAVINSGLPSVPRLRWLNEDGTVVKELQRGEIVTLYAPIPGIPDGETTADIWEADSPDADDFLGTIKMIVKDGIASAKWRTVWITDGFGLDGDPEYVFVVDNVSSPELTVH